MKITLERENVTTVVGYEKNEDGFIVSCTTKHADREYISIDKYDKSWQESSVRFFFFSRVNGIVGNDGKIVDIEP